jgi:hypothetical protein
VLAGVLLAAAAAGSASDPSVDTGAVLLGGGLFGIASGCSAAGVAAAVARSDERSRRPDAGDSIDPVDDRLSRPAAAIRDDGVVATGADLDGVRFAMRGLPRRHPTRVLVRLERYSRRAELAGCAEAQVMIDGKLVSYPAAYEESIHGRVVQGALQIELDIAVLRDIAAAKTVEFVLCAVRRRLSIKGADAVDEFVTRFDAHVPPGTPRPALSPAAPGGAHEAPATSAPTGIAADAPDAATTAGNPEPSSATVAP